MARDDTSAKRDRRSRNVPPVVAGGDPVATWTVLFTDVVGSTEWRVRVGEEAFDRVRNELDRRVTEVLAANGGAIVKSTGDGVMAGFTATTAALRGAVALQQAIAERNLGAPDPVLLRIGVGVGDAIAEDGDLHGAAVVEAARLCAIANGGMILCSEAVRAVSANRSGCRFDGARSVELRGLPGPVLVHEVAWEPPEASRPRVTFRVLGPLVAEGPAGPLAVGGPKEQLVLAVLLARANTVVPLDTIADSIWGDRPPRTAERTVHAYIARLRRAFAPDQGGSASRDVLVTVGRGYRLDVEPAQVDAMQFEALARRGASLLREGDGASAAETLRTALEMWRGQPYADFADVELCAVEATRLEELRQSAHEDLIDAALAAGQGSELVPELERMVRAHPFRERLWGQLIVALYRSGRQRDALEAYQRARRLLADELGIEPGPELRRLEAAVLAQDSALDRITRPAPRPTGLPLALDSVGPAFVGRERELRWLRTAWEAATRGDGGFVSVLGPEGMGKTRLVAAIAREAHSDGAAVLYGRCDHAHRGARSLLDQALGSGGTSVADANEDGAQDGLAAAITRYLPVWSGGRPVLLVLDDLHRADAEALEVVADLATWCRASSMLVVGAFQGDGDEGASEGRAQLVLGPLGPDAVSQICQLYEPDGWTADEVLHVADLTGGVPLLVHEQASAWAQQRATRQVEEATGRLAASRGRLVTTRGEVADGVEGIQRLLDQRRAQLAGREAVRQADRIAALAGCPYKGLARFEQSDAANFFGRERLVAELIARLAETSLLAVVGPSGSGKSSLIRAGLLPALAAGVIAGTDPRQTLTMVPGPDPMRELKRRLRDRDASSAFVLFVDQFEELFNLGASPAQQAEFVGALLAVAERTDAAVVLAIRADHLGRCAAHPELADALTGNDVLVGPMKETELRRTIELPAQRAGLEIEAGLVDTIVRDVAGRAGALPLLSTALAETWERRSDRTLTLAGYRAAGGVNGALARLAEDAYHALPPGSAVAAKRILLRLCDTGESGERDLRRRLPIVDAVNEGDAEAHAALEFLADRRLLIVDDDTVEVVHEALLREWPRLRTWLEEDVQGRGVHRRLGEAARAWDGAGRDASELYRGTRLGAATEWAAVNADLLNRTERAFLIASQDEASRELDEAERRVKDGQRSNRRLRRLLAGIGVALALTLVAGALAVRQNREAQLERDRARAANTEAQARTREAQRERDRASAANAEAQARARDVALQRVVNEADGLRDTRRDLGALLAVAAYGLEQSPATLSALLGTFTAVPTFERTIPVDVSGVADAAFLPDGSAIAMVDAKGSVTMVDAETGEAGRTFAPVVDDAGWCCVVGSPDSRSLAVLSILGPHESPLRVWDLESGKPRFPDVMTGVTRGSIAYSGDGSLIAVAGGPDGNAEIRRASDGSLVQAIAGLPSPDNALTTYNTTSLLFLPDGSLVIGTLPGPIRIVDPATGHEKRRLQGPRESANILLQLAKDGRRLFGWGLDGAVAFDLATGQEIWSTTSVPSCNDIVVAELIGSLLCSRPDGRVIAFDLETGARTDAPFDYQFGGIAAMTASADGTTLIQAGGHAVSRWRLDGGGAVAHLLSVGPEWVPQEFDARGQILLAKAGGQGVTGGLLLIDAGTGEVVDRFEGVAGGTALLTPDRFAVIYSDGKGGMYDSGTGTAVPPAQGGSSSRALPFPPQAAAVLRDGIVLWSNDRIQALRGGELVEPSAKVPGGIRNLTMSTDGSRMFTLEEFDLVQRDPSTGEPTARDSVSGIVEAVTTPDVVVVATDSGRMQVLDADSLQPSGPEFPGVHGSVELFRLADDEKRLLVISAGRTLQLADLPTRTFLGDPIDMGPDPTANESLRVFAPAMISHDGHHLAFGVARGVVVWDLTPATLITAACRVAGRDLTQAEWQEYLGSLGQYRQICPDRPVPAA